MKRGESRETFGRGGWHEGVQPTATKVGTGVVDYTISSLGAAVVKNLGQLGVTRARLNQLLRLRRHGEPETLTTAMIAKVDTPEGRALYKKRAATIEPVFAQIKHNRKIRSLARRGLSAVDSEWKLICATTTS